MADPAVQALLDAINANDRAAFFAALTPDATMSEDGPSVNGDYFWFQAFNRDTAEFLPDYYLATGTYDHWRPLIEHCRL